jgi:hypothetical protein
MADWQEWAHVATVGGVLVGLAALTFEKRRERIDRENGTYHALDEAYIEFLKLSLDHPDLHLPTAALLAGQSSEPDPERLVRHQLVFEVLVSLLERAYVMYHRHGRVIRDAQWKGWDAYATRWAKRRDFAALWKQISADEYDARFVAYIEALMKGESAAPPGWWSRLLPVWR